MRRSEIIKLMVNAYSDRIKDQMIYFCKKDADRVLTAMEDAGMLPPYINIEIEGQPLITPAWEPETSEVNNRAEIEAELQNIILIAAKKFKGQQEQS